MPPDKLNDNQRRLRAFIEEEHGTMLSTLRLYAVRAGIAPTWRDAGTTAQELLNEVTVEALDHADRFRPDGQPKAWLLGIAANLIKRRQVKSAKDFRREPLIRDLYPNSQVAMGDDELFDRLASSKADNPAHTVESDDYVESILVLLTTLDREIVRLAVLNGMDGNALAAELDITPGAARVRLHRALRRLREALNTEVTHV